MSKIKKYNKEKFYNDIKEFINKNGYSPTMRELLIVTGMKSTSTVHSYLKDLQEEGLITKGKHFRVISLNENDFLNELKSLCTRYNKDFNSFDNKITINL